MATDPRTIIDSSQDPGLSPTPNNSASSNVADYDTRERKTVIIDYTDPPLYGVPELQIFNDPGGSNGQVQFNKGNRFGGDNNLVWNSKVRTLSILGNLRASGEITGRIVTNTTKLKITGGEAGDTLITDGTGNLSWVPAPEAAYGNANVANYLPTYTGNLNGGNINIPNGYANVTGTANTVGGGATVGVRSILAIDSAFGSNDANAPASAQAIRGRVTGSNLTKTRNYVAGVTGQYLVTGTNASEFINTGLLGVVGDQTTTANAAVVAYLDGDGGLTTAGSAYGVSMKNSTPGSGFDYGLDLQFIDLNLAGTTAPFKQADIRFNNGAVQRDTSTVQCLGNASTVVYTASGQYQHTIRLLIQVEGYVGAPGSWDTQACEMIIAKSFRANALAASVYGVVHTSVAPLATFTAEWNALTNRVEVLCATPSANSVYVRIFATEITTSD